jgi:uncharacterized membrane protein SirB2
MNGLEWLVVFIVFGVIGFMSGAIWLVLKGLVLLIKIAFALIFLILKLVGSLLRRRE